MTARDSIDPPKPRPRGPRCARLVNGVCPFAGGRCIDGVRLTDHYFKCAFFKRKPAEREKRNGTER